MSLHQESLQRKYAPKIIRQWGPDATQDQEPSPIQLPFRAEHTLFGNIIIVDRKGPLNRVIEVNRDGQLVWEYRGRPRINFATRLSATTMLISQNESLLWLDKNGRTEKKVVLPMPSGVINCGDVRGRIIAVGGDEGVFLLSIGGEILSHFYPSETTFIEPCDLKFCRDGSLLITDAISATASIISQGGARTALFGTWRNPSTSRGSLAAPYSACEIQDGTILVADWRGGSISVFERNGEFLHLLSCKEKETVSAPTYVREASGGLLIADSVQQRVFLWNGTGRPAWSYGSNAHKRSSLQFPRSVQYQKFPRSSLLITDTYNNRIVEASSAGMHTLVDGRSHGLRLPRSAVRTADRRMAIADGLNSRVLVFDQSNILRHEIKRLQIGTRTIHLDDPHHAEITKDGHVLITDAGLKNVYLVRMSGQVVRTWGTGGVILDPHYSEILTNGGLVVASSGNSLISIYSPKGRFLQSIQPDGDTFLYPRFVKRLNKSFIVADSDQNRLVEIFDSGQNRIIGPMLDTHNPGHINEFRVPKWVDAGDQGNYFVADYLNSRVVEVA